MGADTMPALESLLDVILKSRGGQISVLNRVIICGMLRSSMETKDLENYHRDLAITCSLTEDVLRGLLLHFSNDAVLHLLEGPAQHVSQFVEVLRTHPANPFEEESLKIVLATEDIGSYGFP